MRYFYVFVKGSVMSLCNYCVMFYPSLKLPGHCVNCTLWSAYVLRQMLVYQFISYTPWMKVWLCRLVMQNIECMKLKEKGPFRMNLEAIKKRMDMRNANKRYEWLVATPMIFCYDPECKPDRSWQNTMPFQFCWCSWFIELFLTSGQDFSFYCVPFLHTS